MTAAERVRLVERFETDVAGDCAVKGGKKGEVGGEKLWATTITTIKLRQCLHGRSKMG